VYVAPACAATLAFAAVDAQTAGGAVIAADGAPLIGIDTVELLLQPAEDVTVIATVTLPLDAGVNVMAFVPAPPVMVPFRIDQL
jgi:FtsP/CotA-like multicopper oxidase with cupredoxin domain